MPLLLALMVVLGMVIGARLNSAQLARYSSPSDRNLSNKSEPGRLEELIRYVEARYVDEVDTDEMIEKAINNLLDELDPHSNYISASQLREVNEVLEGNFEGIGVEFLIVEDTVMVVSPIAGGPSEAVGILPGDKIVEIEDSLIAGVGVEVRDVVELLRGDKGSKVNVGIRRGYAAEVLPFTITRDEIPDFSVDVGYMIDDKTGYIKISRFSATTYQEFMEQLETLVDQHGMENLIIDLRQNPGGYLQEATNILSQLFTEKGKVLVYTEGRSVRRSEYETTGRPFFRIGDVSVLIDEGSASASEIIAGAIQDWDRGYIIGRRSFGKGLVQEQYNLKDGSALRLTVARYYTPSDRLIQKGYGDDRLYDEDLAKRFESGELQSRDSIAVDDTTRYYTSEGRVVYGGGGITPDIFIPIDTLLLNDDYLRLRQYLPEYVYRYYQDQQEALRAYDDLNVYQRNFRLSDRDFRAFVDYAIDKGVAFADPSLARVDEAIRLLFKARLSRNLFGDEGFFAIWNEQDPVVQRAVKLMRQPVPLTSLRQE
ncbi:MAG: S41 family peptidase [Bacteroidota bacterium]